jgi:hypothetical protein
MTDLLETSSLILATAGVIALAFVASPLATRKTAVPVTMELWTAAGLLRLCGEPSWTRIATAAAIIAVRRLVLWRSTSRSPVRKSRVPIEELTTAI